jgi:hypothetical protein
LLIGLRGPIYGKVEDAYVFNVFSKEHFFMDTTAIFNCLLVFIIEKLHAYFVGAELNKQPFNLQHNSKIQEISII